MGVMAFCFWRALNIGNALQEIRHAVRNAELSSEQYAEFRAREKWVAIYGITAVIAFCAMLVSAVLVSIS